MFREEYKRLNKQVIPSEELLQDTIWKADGIENKSRIRTYCFRKTVIALLAVCLCLSIGIPVLANTIEPIYQLMYNISPTIAQFFSSVQESDEDNGIEMEVVSVYIHENIAEIYITMKDLMGNRIDETTDLLDSFSINRPFDSSAYCKLVGYDEITKEAKSLITTVDWGNKEITGARLTFAVSEFLSIKKQ